MPGPELATITDGALTARINPFGAELWSLTDGAGREYMTSADPAFWSGHAPLLFPIVGAVNGGRYRLDGREYAIAKHGFARTSQFAAELVASDRIRFTLVDSETSRLVYPFAFVLTAEFAVKEATLAMAVTVRNTGDRPMPFSFGFHPAFAWPVPDGGPKTAHRVVFERAEPEPVRRIDQTTATLLPQPEPSPVNGRVLVPDAALFEKDALIWDRLNSRALSFSGESGPSLEIAFPDSPNLGIWQKPGAPFLAIEPWQGFNDPQGFSGDLREKPGIVMLAPGGARRFRMDVTVRSG
ncbi:MAG: aldose 1-epimerase family protein [Croceibacterium sp.]